MSLYAECPACQRVLRPKSLDPGACWNSLRMHVKSKARQGCNAHIAIRDSIFGAGRIVCPACPAHFASVSCACAHLANAQDEAHQNFRVAGAPQPSYRHSVIESRNVHHSPVMRDHHAPGYNAPHGPALITEPPHVRSPPRSGWVSACLRQVLSCFAINRQRAQSSSRTLPQQCKLDSDLYASAKSGWADQVRDFLHQGADATHKVDDGYTALMAACEYGHAAVVKLLVDHDASLVNARNAYGQTPLSLAAINGHEDAVVELMKARNLDLEGLWRGMTAAQHARRAEKHDIADMLAAAAQQEQVRRIVAAVTCSGDGSTVVGGKFDSVSQRVGALSAALAVPQEEDQDAANLCKICWDRPVDTVLQPCFHACFCAACAADTMQACMPCPICKTRVQGRHRIYF